MLDGGSFPDLVDLGEAFPTGVLVLKSSDDLIDDVLVDVELAWIEALVDKVVEEFLLDERQVVGRQLATEPIYNIHRGGGRLLAHDGVGVAD